MESIRSSLKKKIKKTHSLRQYITDQSRRVKSIFNIPWPDQDILLFVYYGCRFNIFCFKMKSSFNWIEMNWIPILKWWSKSTEKEKNTFRFNAWQIQFWIPKSSSVSKNSFNSCRYKHIFRHLNFNNNSYVSRKTLETVK